MLHCSWWPACMVTRRTLSRFFAKRCTLSRTSSEN